MPLTPAETMFSSAVTCPALSPSYLPAAVVSFTPCFSASFSAPSRILTKKGGLVSVLVIRPTFTSPPSFPEEPEPEPHPVSARHTR